jgi:hypothetical protein
LIIKRLNELYFSLRIKLSPPIHLQNRNSPIFA